MRMKAGDWMVQAEVDGSILLRVPGGPFLAGGPEHFESGIEPFELSLETFFLALHPVTQGQYARFVAATGHPPPRTYSAGRPLEALWKGPGPRPQEVDHPVVGVRWSDAVAYCQWAKLRLPTELEWEKAARGPGGHVFPWGKEWDPGRCRNDGNRSRATTAPVWQHAAGASPFGIYDMSGNVWEWCAERFDPGAYRRYRSGKMASSGGVDLAGEGDANDSLAGKDPAGKGSLRSARGGSWFNVNPESFRATFRHGFPEGDADGCYGFRVAWSG